jgi:hypothetical protein
VGLPVVARAFARDGQRPDDARSGILRLGACIVVAVAAVMGLQASGEQAFDLSTYPVEAMRYVDAHGLMGERLFADDVDGGYVILRYTGRQKVFIDDRYDMYPRSVIFDYFDLTAGKPGWSRILDQYHVEVIVWGRDTSLAALLDGDPAWQRVHRDATDAVWVRAGT